MQKNAPSLATWGKSTFSEGGGDNWCMQKSTLVRNCRLELLQRSRISPQKIKKVGFVGRSLRKITFNAWL
jgi:hypothetical protein